MELTTIVGIIVGLMSVIGAMYFKHLSFDIFLNPAAFFVIFVGTVATILNSFPGKNLKDIGKLFKILFTQSKSTSEEAIILSLVEYATLAKREGILSLESKLEGDTDPFIKKGLKMVIDGASDEFINDVLSSEVAAMEERHALNASIFSSAGTYAPTLGVLGAVFGLIAAMGDLDNTEAMSEAIAAAFMATILGIFTGYVLWNPFATKLRVKSKHEVLLKSIIIEGILSIQKGESPVMVKEKLLSLLPLSLQEKIGSDEKTE